VIKNGSKEKSKKDNEKEINKEKMQEIKTSF
jgi:hypothetical protein